MILSILITIAIIIAVVAAFISIVVYFQNKNLFNKIFEVKKYTIMYSMDYDYVSVRNSKTSKVILSIPLNNMKVSSKYLINETPYIMIYNYEKNVKNSLKKYFETEKQFDIFVKCWITSKLKLSKEFKNLEKEIKNNINNYKIVKL